nr:AbiH family protein [Clostridium estertheticum]
MYYDEVASVDFREQEADQLTKSYFKNTYKNVDKIISSNQVFFSSLNTVHEIYVLGHSLSDIDLKYFEKINHNVMPWCLWHISYYSECDYNNVIHQLNKIGVLNYKLIRIDEISIETV